MAWRLPWISRDDHDEQVAQLKDRIAELESERKRLTDQVLVLLGGRPLYFPESAAQLTPAVDPETEQSLKDTEAQLDEFIQNNKLDYIARYRPSALGSAMATEMRREGRRGFVAPPAGRTPAETPAVQTSVKPNGKASALFDKAEAEVKAQHS